MQLVVPNDQRIFKIGKFEWVVPWAELNEWFNASEKGKCANRTEEEESNTNTD